MVFGERRFLVWREIQIRKFFWIVTHKYLIHYTIFPFLSHCVVYITIVAPWKRSPLFALKRYCCFCQISFCWTNNFSSKNQVFQEVFAQTHLLKWIWNKPLCVKFFFVLMEWVVVRRGKGFKFACLSNCSKKSYKLKV